MDMVYTATLAEHAHLVHVPPSAACPADRVGVEFTALTPGGSRIKATQCFFAQERPQAEALCAQLRRGAVVDVQAPMGAHVLRLPDAAVTLLAPPPAPPAKTLPPAAAGQCQADATVAEPELF